MKDEEVIYTDGHGVKITNEKFYAEKNIYNLDGITQIDLQRIPASSGPGVTFFVLGFLAIVAGSLDVFDNLSFSGEENIYSVETSMFAIGLGIAFVMGGVGWMIAAKDKYAVEIRTAEGEKQPIISQSKEYTAHIVASLKKAYFRYVKNYEYNNKRRKKVIIT